MIRQPSGSSSSETRCPRRARPRTTSTSMISSCSSGRSSRWTRPWPGTSCSMRLRIRSVAETAGLDPQQLEVLQVPRVVAAGDDPVAEVLLLGDLADEDVVLVVAGDGDDEVGALDARALEHPQLGGVAVLDGVLELLLDAQVARRSPSMSVTSWPLAMSSRARLRPTLPPPAMRTYIRRPPSSDACSNISIADFVGQIVCSPCSAYQSERARDRCTRTMTCGDVEAPLRDLGDHEVRVVAVGGGDEDVGLADAGLLERLDLERRADGEAAAARPPRRCPWPASSRSCESGSSSRTETS